jgi:mono/diheme cytochrome c family protein
MMLVRTAGAFACLAAGLGLAQSLPDGPGKETFERVCSACHSPEAVIGLHKTKAEWKSKVTEMLQEATDVPDADVTAIVDYLAKNFPPKSNP